MDTVKKSGTIYNKIFGAITLWATTITDTIATVYAVAIKIGDIDVICRGWNEYAEAMQMVSDKYADTKTGVRAVLYTPNLQYLWGWLEYHHEWYDVFGSKPGEPRRACTVDMLEFRCLEQLSGAKVETIADSLLVPAVDLGEYDITKMRGVKTPLTMEEETYIRSYTQVCVDYVAQVMHHEKSNVASIRWTLTGDLRSYMRKLTLYGKYSDSYKSRIHALNLTTEEYALLKMAQRGGLVYATPWQKDRELENVSSWDISSSYAAVMCAYEYPTRSLGVIDCEYSWDDMVSARDKHLFIVGVCEIRGYVAGWGFKYIKADWCEELVGEKVDSDGYIVSADAMSIVLTNIDCEILHHHCEGASFLCYRAARWRTGYLPHQLVYGILSLYKRKTEYKGVIGKELEYRRTKSQLSSIFGDSAMDPIQPHVEYDPATRRWIPDDRSVEERIAEYNNSQSRYNFYAWGVAVTAYARLRLVEMIEQIDVHSKHDGLSASDLCYSDTDCVKMLDGAYYAPLRAYFNQDIAERIDKCMDTLHIDKEMARPKDPNGVVHQLGAWEDETEEVVNLETGEIIDKRYKRLKILGTKRYMYSQLDDNGDEKIVITVAGCNKKQGSLYFSRIGFDGFTEEAVVPAMYSGFVTVRHTPYKKSGSFTDYEGKEQVFDEHGMVVRSLTDYNFSRDAVAAMILQSSSIRCGVD